MKSTRLSTVCALLATSFAASARTAFAQPTPPAEAPPTEPAPAPLAPSAPSNEPPAPAPITPAPITPAPITPAPITPAPSAPAPSEEKAKEPFAFGDFTWLNGTFLEDWLIHNIDVCLWAKNAWPASVQGMGGRQVRKDADAMWSDLTLARFAGEPREARVGSRWDAAPLALLPGQSAAGSG